MKASVKELQQQQHEDKTSKALPAVANQLESSSTRDATVRCLPIILSGEMVRATLAGTKTQTRRVVKPQPPDDGELVVGPYHPTLVDSDGDAYPGAEVYGVWNYDGEYAVRCPYGKPGDRLWAKEKFAPRSDVDPTLNVEKARHYCMYAADGGDPRDPMNWHDFGGRWTSSRFMPRWASRLTLEITEVRAERVQEISDEDAIAEGAEVPVWASDLKYAPSIKRWTVPDNDFIPLLDGPRAAYAALWDALNAKRGYSWESNPWVWVLTFRRVEAGR